MEILRQNAYTNAIFVPIGGGGLIAGIAAYVKAVNPTIKVIGVETEDADAMYQSLKQGKRVVLDKVGLFADGTAVKQVGKYTFEICKHFVDEVIHVTTDELCAAIKDIFEDTRAIVEPSGALGVAGLKKYVERGSGN
jgi:threonine dehydratase